MHGDEAFTEAHIQACNCKRNHIQTLWKTSISLLIKTTLSLKWNLFTSTFTWYYLYFRILQKWHLRFFVLNFDFRHSREWKPYACAACASTFYWMWTVFNEVLIFFPFTGSFLDVLYGSSNNKKIQVKLQPENNLSQFYTNCCKILSPQK